MKLSGMGPHSSACDDPSQSCWFYRPHMLSQEEDKAMIQQMAEENEDEHFTADTGKAFFSLAS